MILHRSFTVYAGLTNIHNHTEGQIVSKAIPHENYLQKKNYDIAVLILEKPFTLSDLIQPGKLPDWAPQEDVVATLAGWGTTEHGGGSDDLRYVHMSLVSEQKCWDEFSDLERGTTLCFFDKGRGGCFGDSGSGFVIRGTNTVIGVYSVVRTDPVTVCSTEHLHGATNVWHFKKWIESKMKE